MQLKTKKHTYIFAMAIGILFVFAYLGRINAQDDSITNIPQDQDISDDTQKKIDELNKRAAVYQEIIDIKKQQSQSLNNQISIMDANIDQVQTQIDINKDKVADLNDQIDRMRTKINQKTAQINDTKDSLAKLLQSFYEINQQNLIAVYFSHENVSSFMVTRDRISQIGDKIKSMLDDLNANKQDLLRQSTELDQKKIEVVETSQEFEQQSATLVSAKQKKQDLLEQTKGEEIRYAQLLKRVQEQKNELLDIDQFFAASGLSAESYPKPPSSTNASLNWFYSQKDPRWANETIGNSNSTLKAYGCAVAAVAMVFTKYGDAITPKKLADKPIFSWDLIAWPLSWPDAKLTLSADGKSHGNINWSTVDSEIAKDHPVIVYIKKTKGGGHYAVIHHKDSKGKYVVHDPYFGPNIYLDTSRALVGAMGENSGTTIDQMIIYK